jgi:hypothetical protein
VPSDAPSSPAPTACAVNLGPREIAKRKLGGWITGGISLVGFAGLEIAQSPRSWHLALFLPIFLAGVSFFQATAKT